MDMRTWCPLCKRKELLGDHDTANVQPRDWLRGFTGPVIVRSEPAAVPVKAVSVAKPVTPRHETPATKQTFVTCAADGCSNPVPPKTTGRPGRYCGPTCRKRASRRK